ncbi:unnamed protein product, partial [Candidula unifasciata]
DAAMVWPGLDTHVDAIIVVGSVYLFERTEYRLLTNNSITGPRRLNACWPDIFRTGGVDAAANRNGKPYFFKGCNFWTPSETTSSNGFLLRDLATINLPCDLDAAWESGPELIISKANQYWIWGSSMRGPFPLSGYLSLCTWNWGFPSAVTLPNPLVCNGDARLCFLTVDKVTLAGSHNAGSGFSGRFASSPCFYQNQNTSVLEQLRFGMRYLDVDSCWSECGKLQITVNPTEIVMVNFNHDMTDRDRVIPELVRQVSSEMFFSQEHRSLGSVVLRTIIISLLQIEEVLSPFLNSHFRETGDWPTLGQAVRSGKRLFVIITKEVIYHSIHSQKRWIVDERYLGSTYKLILVFGDCSSVVSSTRDKCRQLAERSLLEVTVIGMLRLENQSSESSQHTTC